MENINPTNLSPNEPEDDDWKRKTYVIGISAGTLFGFIASYLFTRAAEEETDGKKPESIPTGQLLTLLLALLGLIRQIAELGKPKKK